MSGFAERRRLLTRVASSPVFFENDFPAIELTFVLREIALPAGRIFQVIRLGRCEEELSHVGRLLRCGIPICRVLRKIADFDWADSFPADQGPEMFRPLF